MTPLWVMVFVEEGGGDSQVHVHKVNANLSLKDKNGLV